MFPWGNQAADCTLTNFYVGGSTGHCIRDTSPVGSYPSGASPYGALDMAGNVWEWVNDWMLSDYYNTYPVDGWPNNPPGPDTGTWKVLRGGSWSDNGHAVRVAWRSDSIPGFSGFTFGFRCAADAP
jgi:formylglycine-generating enzyme required for sulfatase activity